MHLVLSVIVLTAKGVKPKVGAQRTPQDSEF